MGDACFTVFTLIQYLVQVIFKQALKSLHPKTDLLVCQNTNPLKYRPSKKPFSQINGTLLIDLSIKVPFLLTHF